MLKIWKCYENLTVKWVCQIKIEVYRIEYWEEEVGISDLDILVSVLHSTSAQLNMDKEKDGPLEKDGSDPNTRKGDFP